MYHYNFTNDLRISNLDSILKDAANAFITNTVPSAVDDKSKNNNYMTVGFYFNLKAKGNCAKLASNGNIKKVVLNFIKKFQYPNPRTTSDYENAIADGILLAPMRDIVKLLHIFSLINIDMAFLTKEEIKNFIFYNDELAKRKNYNLLNTANQIIKYRKDFSLPSNIDTNENNHVWNQPERQIREMIKTLNYTGCFLEDENGIKLKTENISRDNKADLFEIINCNSYWKGASSEDYQKYMDEMTIEEDDMSENIIYNGVSLNRIIFGAPGTGKSHKLERESSIFENNIERVTFHPNYSYAQFVGAYKPVTINADINPNITKEQQGILNILKDTSKTGQEKYDLLYESFKQSNLTRLPLLLGIYTDDDFKTKKADGSPASNDNDVERNHGRAIRPYINIKEKNSNNEIVYEFVPGPFIRTYIKAKKTGQNVLLLIEEINRANVAAVFGDVFQLLDRDDTGDSEYPITTSEDLRKFLAKPENLGGTPDDYKTLSIPSNMYIWATMNSADQGVLPMDAAFKRRWDFEYIGINEGEKDLGNVKIPVPDVADTDEKTKKYVEVEWNKLRKAINEKLKSISGVNEDKLIGPFFIGNKTKIEKAASNPEDFCKSFKSKVLMYLFEDVCKMRPKALFDLNMEHPHYSDICAAFDEKGVGVFGFKNADDL